MPTTRSQVHRAEVATSNEGSQRTTNNGVLQNEAQLKQRASKDISAESERLTKSTSRTRATPDEPPRFTINLSLPPEQRYLELCAELKSEIRTLPRLFDEVVGGMVPLPHQWLHRVCRWTLWKVYDPEENMELKGISKATGVSMYLLVCFNVLLDLFMGCSSGGASIGDGKGGSKMVHFRTLDWGMPALRRILVWLDFVTEAGGPVIASSITYAGFVGVLTGVRKDFSVSLNFRPNRHRKGMFTADAAYVWQLMMVLLGQRPSIASTLRKYLIPRPITSAPRCWSRFGRPSENAKKDWYCIPYVDVLRSFGRAADGTDSGKQVFCSTACYLCFSNGLETTVIEKDRVTARLRSSEYFIVITNNDEDLSPCDLGSDAQQRSTIYDVALAEIVEEAKDRKECAEHNWHNMTRAALRSHGAHSIGVDNKTVLSLQDVVEMVQMYPTTNETTHFACVMDAQEGKVRWCRRWRKPVGAKWIREHKSSTW